MSEKQEKIQRLRELNKNIYLFNYFRCYENHVEIPYNVGRVRSCIKKK